MYYIIEALSRLTNESQQRIGTKMYVILKSSLTTIYSKYSCTSLWRVLIDHIYRYDPGDVAVIHPYAPPDAVDTLLKLQDWDDTADDSFNIERNMFGMHNSLPP